MSYVPPYTSDKRRRQAVPWHRRILIWLGFRTEPLVDTHRDSVYPSDLPQAPHMVERYEIQELQFEAPALGDGFSFNVNARCVWHGEAEESNAEQLQKEILQRKREIAAQLETAVRDITRQHSPQECADVERRINEELSYSWSVDGVDKITCQVRALVGLDVAIRDLQRKTGLRGIQVDDERKATRQQVDRLREQVSLWRALLEEWKGDQATNDAVVLTLRPGELENIASRPRVTVDPERERLIAQASNWLEGIRRHGVEESLFGFNSALLTLMQNLGMPPPPRTAFGQTPDERAQQATGGVGRQEWDGQQDADRG